MTNKKTGNGDNKTLLRRLLYTIGALIVFHLLSYIAIPGVDAKQLVKVANNGSLQMLSMFSGGGFSTYSMMSMGVTAYITAQIVVQLLQSDVVPILTQWAKEGEVGRHKLDQLTRIITLILAFIQSIGITAGINQMTSSSFLIDNSIKSYILSGIIMTAGTFIGMWLGDQITEKGLGNGISVIIMAGILSHIPDTINSTFKNKGFGENINWLLVVGIGIFIILLTWLIVWFNTSEHRTQIQYARKPILTGKESYLPLKIIVPGVVPIIFASSLLSIPQTIIMFFRSQYTKTWYQVLGQFFTLNTTTGIFLYALLIIFFTYLYSLVQLQPEKIADNFTKQEAYVLGVPPRQPTAVYFKDLLNQLSFPGSMFLMLISIIPMIITNYISPNIQLGLSGSSLLIIVGVLTDIANQIKGLKLKTDYDGFLTEEADFD